MSSISSLKATLNSLKAKKKKANEDLKKYKKRKDQVETLRGKLIGVAESDYDDVDKYASKIIAIVGQAIKGSPSVGNITSTVSSDKEGSGSGDAHISGANNSLGTELKRINQKIEDLEKDIKTYDRKIKETEAAIKQEEKKALVDALKKVRI